MKFTSYHIKAYWLMFLLILVLIEIHTGRVTILLDKYFPRPAQKQSRLEQQKQAQKKERMKKYKPFTAEENPAQLAGRYEKMMQNKDYDLIVEETENRKDVISQAYRALVILESGEYPKLFAEAISIMNKVLRRPELPDNLQLRLIQSLGDPGASTNLEPELH
ncbi:MAG: hypothetical protein ACQETH_12895 [Candidatus Rifleibacteriota bacterium]